MKTTVIFLVSVFMVVASNKTIAQVSNKKADQKTSSVKTDVIRVQHAAITNSGSRNLKLKQKNVKAQIYIDNDWPLGKIVLRDGGIIDNYCMRYNLLADQLEFITGRDTLIFANPQDLSTVSFGRHIFIYENYFSENVIRQGYFELLVPGKNKLMLKRLVTNQRPDSKYPEDAALTKCKVDECYYISNHGMPANKVRCNRRSALTFLDKHKEDIAEYLRITGNKVRTIEDLKILVSYYNSLDEDF